MFRALLLACLTLGPAAATPPRMSDPARPPATPLTRAAPAQLAQARPTLDLLVTLRLLADLVARGTLAQGAEVRAALADLPTHEVLGPLTAERTLAQVRAALTPPERQALDQARAALEGRANLLLARARFASPDGPPNLALNRYGFMVPGGLALVRRVAADPTLNPYAEAGPNAEVLRRLIAGLLPDTGLL